MRCHFEVRAISGLKNKNKKYWDFPKKEYSSKEKRILVAECLAVLCKVIMGNQVYSFGGKTYLQGEHGSIGDEAVGMIASLVMIWWSRRLRLKLKKLKIENYLMKIFVDDLNGVFSSLPKGTAYIDGKLMFNEKKADEDKDLPDDQVTMNVIKDIANDIIPSQFL